MLRVYETLAGDKPYSGDCATGDTQKCNTRALPLELIVCPRIGKEKHVSCLSSSGIHPAGKVYKHTGSMARAVLQDVTVTAVEAALGWGAPGGRTSR